MNATITYRDRHFLDRFRCIDTERKTYLQKIWYVGDLLYGYIDRFNIKCIATEDIIAIELA